MDSSDEALCEMLGLGSLQEVGSDSEDAVIDTDSTNVPSLDDKAIGNMVTAAELSRKYIDTSVCVFPISLSPPGALMRRITDEIVWGGSKIQADRTYETIQVLKHGAIEKRRVLTRLENFVNHHDEWSRLCHGHLRQCISAVAGEEMVLYKEKLNLKPPGGSGFAPHLDAPSLRVALGDDGPQTFVTVMVAIDNMTVANGCLRICTGAWSEKHHCPIVTPEQDGNPDAGGRAGAIPLDESEKLDFGDILCQGGDIVAFNGWAPHRSAGNVSPFPRRAVFLTYNPKREGDCHDRYYQRMAELRQGWRDKIGLGSAAVTQDEEAELAALATIPRI